MANHPPFSLCDILAVRAAPTNERFSSSCRLSSTPCSRRSTDADSAAAAHRIRARALDCVRQATRAASPVLRHHLRARTQVLPPAQAPICPASNPPSRQLTAAVMRSQVHSQHDEASSFCMSDRCAHRSLAVRSRGSRSGTYILSLAMTLCQLLRNICSHSHNAIASGGCFSVRARSVVSLWRQLARAPENNFYTRRGARQRAATRPTWIEP